MIVKYLTVFLIIPILSVSLAAQSLDSGIKDLSSQISSELSEGNKKKIAVIEFSDLEGRINELGKFLSEELITRLFMTKKFYVIERQLLNKVIQEHQLNTSGLIDEFTAKELGKILGVEAICSGTVTDLVNKVKINARLISTETGAIFAVASASIEKDEVVSKLMGTKLSTNKSIVRPIDGKVLEGDIFFKEDFFSLRDGEAPAGWFGTNHCVVKTKGRRKVFTTFEPGPMVLTIPAIEFPKNFKIKWVIQSTIKCLYAPNSYVQIGNLKAGVFKHHCDDYTAFINNSKTEVKLNRNIPIIFELEKVDSIFKLRIDGKQVALIRNSAFKPGNSLTINLGENTRYQLIVDLLLVECIALSS